MAQEVPRLCSSTTETSFSRLLRGLAEASVCDYSGITVFSLRKKKKKSHFLMHQLLIKINFSLSLILPG